MATVGNVPLEQQGEDLILLLAGIHATEQFVAAGPVRGVTFSLHDGHGYSIFLGDS